MGALCGKSREPALEFELPSTKEPDVALDSEVPCAPSSPNVRRTSSLHDADGQPAGSCGDKAVGPQHPPSGSRDGMRRSIGERLAKKTTQNEWDRGAGHPALEHSRTWDCSFACGPEGSRTSPGGRGGRNPLTNLCATACKVPICCVSDLHSGHPWGWMERPVDYAAHDSRSSYHIPFSETPFCKWTLQQPPNIPLVIEDTLLDERFSSSPHVKHAPHIRFYAGIALVSLDGNPVGALCIMDTSPAAEGILSVQSRLSLLASFATMAAHQLKRDQMLATHQAAGDALLAERSRLQHLMDMVGHGASVMLIEVPSSGERMNLQSSSAGFSDAMLSGMSTGPLASRPPSPPSSSACPLSSSSVGLSKPLWRVVCVNEAWEASTGHVNARIANHSFWSLCRAQGDELVRKACCSAVARQLSFSATLQMRSGAEADGALMTLRLLFNHAEKSRFNGTDRASVPSSSSLSTLFPGGCSYCYFVSIASASNPIHPAPYEGHSNSSCSSLLSAGLTLLNETSACVGKGTPRPSVELVDQSALLLDAEMNLTQDLQIESLLGHGSFGRVYKGRYRAVPVAIKVLQCTVAQASGHELEALLPSHIEHPNVLRTYKHCTRPLTDVHQDLGGQCGMVETLMVMEYAEHGTLSDAVAQGRFHGGVGQVQAGHGGIRSALCAEEAELSLVLSTAREVASAMCHLHSLDILHGDLTGSNILLCSTTDEGGRGTVAKVADFGLSRILASGHIRTKTYGAVSHTPPELLLTGSLSKAVDVYAFGVILWEVLTGQQPYRGLSQAQVISHIGNGRSLDIRSEWPSGLQKLVAACLCTQPDKRPSFLQVLSQLDVLQEQLC